MPPRCASGGGHRAGSLVELGLTIVVQTARGTFPPGLGEPLNIVISSLSSPHVLSDDGFFDFMVSVNMAGECLGQHQGSDQASNLGDGRGLCEYCDSGWGMGLTENAFCSESERSFEV
jgi:hypothetical protein